MTTNPRDSHRQYMRDWRAQPGKVDRNRAYGRARSRAAQRLTVLYPDVWKQLLAAELAVAEDELRHAASR